MTRLSAETRPAPCKASGRRTSIRIVCQDGLAALGLWRGPPVPVPPARLTRDIGEPGLLSSHNSPGAWDKSCHRAPAPLLDHSHCPVERVPGVVPVDVPVNQRPGSPNIFHPPWGCRSVPPCSHTARPHAPPIPLLRDICARIAAFAFSPTTPAFSVASL